jgi:hypothetical protein
MHALAHGIASSRIHWQRIAIVAVCTLLLVVGWISP